MTQDAGEHAKNGATLQGRWAQLLALHEAWLRKVILARTGEPQAVDDVFQQVALAAVAQTAPIADESKAAPWLHRIAVVQSARHRRSMGRGRRALAAVARNDGGEGGRTTDVLDLLQAKERHDRIRESMARLPPGDAEVLMLKYHERWSYSRIAERLGITARAVDARLIRARKRLRAELQRLGIEGMES